MAYRITDITNAKPEPGRFYMFDSNIWLPILESYYEKKFYNPYQAFFDLIVDDNNGSKIAVTGVMLSEIINRILRDIYFYEFIRDNGEDPKTTKLEFKRDYRHSPSYGPDFDSICANIRAYHQQMVFVNDNLNSYTCKKILKNIPHNLDFNDFLMAKICQDQGISVVTHDADFAVEDLDILTTSPDLLKLMIPTAPPPPNP